MTRIYKKFPFSQPNSVRLNEISREYDQLEAQLRDLRQLRQAIVDGKLDEQTYNFLNMDGSLEQLLLTPRPVDGIACEALQAEQLRVIDIAIEGVLQKLKDSIARMWESLKEWFLDWWDLNRNFRIKLQQKLATFKSTPTALGDPAKFENLNGVVYHKPYWVKMCAACQSLNKELSALPSDGKNLGQWVRSKMPVFVTSLKEFGINVDTKDMIITDGLRPKYDQVMTTLGSARWRFALLGTDMETAIKIISDDIECRKQLNNLEKIFKSADVEDRRALAFLKQLVVRTKSCAFVVGRGLNRVISISVAHAK